MSLGRGGALAQLGAYQLVRRLSVGGWAEVFAACTTSAEGEVREVAIKRLLPHLSEDPSLRQLFLAEAQLLIQLRHPLLTRVYEVIDYASGPFLVMELLEGIDLQTLQRVLVQEGGQLRSEEWCALGLQAALALAYAHQATDPQGEPLHLVHRDVSPHNLMLEPSGHLKLIDFGIATFEGREGHTKTGVLKGKHAYMSPEQVRGESLDGRSDVFALGVVLWELAAGRSLFHAETVIDTLERVEAAHVPELEVVRPDLAPELCACVMACLSRHPHQRPVGAHALAEDLGLILNRLKPKAPAQSPFESAVETTAACYMRYADAFKKVRKGLSACEDAALHETTAVLPTSSEATRDQTSFFDSTDIAAHLERLRAESRQR